MSSQPREASFAPRLRPYEREAHEEKVYSCAFRRFPCFRLGQLRTAMKKILVLLMVIVTAGWAQSQTTSLPQSSAPEILPKTQVNPDLTVTFRFPDPNAKEVKIDLEGAEPVAMQKHADGFWTATIGPLAPDFYGYSFVADGVSLIDPANP